MAFVIAVAARKLGPGAFGAYIAITTYVATAGSVVDFGLARYVTRTISEGNPVWRPLWLAAALRTVLGVVVAALAGGALLFSPGTNVPLIPVLCVAGATFVDLLTDLLFAALRGRAHFDCIARTTIVRSLVSLLATTAFVFVSPNLHTLTVAFFAASVAGLLYTAWQARVLITPGQMPSFAGLPSRPGVIASARTALAATWAFGLSAILCGAYMRIGPAVLARSGPVEVGVYGAAYKIIEAGLFSASILCSILVPYLSATRSASRVQFERMVEASMRLMVIPAFLVANLVIALADPVIAVLYGPRYASATPVLQILGVFFLLTAVTAGVQSAVLIALGELTFASLLTGAALALAIPLNLVLAPKYGATGAAMANCIGEVLVLAGNLVLLRRRGLGCQARLTLLCVGLTIAAVVAQPLPWPASILAPLAYSAAFGSKCLEDLRWSIGALSQGRSLLARPQCG